MDTKRFTYKKNDKDMELCFDWIVYDKDGYCVAAFESEKDAKKYISERNKKYIVSYYWQGDSEDEEVWYFDTKESAWDFIKSEIEKRIEYFNNEGNKKTIIDFDLVKKHLFENGQTEMNDVVYCQISAWWDNWSLTECS